LARAHLLGSKCVDLGLWQPESWVQKITLEKVTVTTVVPTQIFDLVQKKLAAPATLKFLIVGGDYLSAHLERMALDLGWPIIRTFGMTEVCSQLASTTAPGDADLKVLPIHQVKTDENELLLIKSSALFTLQFKYKEKLLINYAEQFCDPAGFYRTSDMARLNQDVIIP
jgi:o-succinylbenzoate---CoA ligase